MSSCIFTLTRGPRRRVPRRLPPPPDGPQRGAALLCAREVPGPGALPRIIRVLIHWDGEADHQPQHVYLGEAAALRLDISGAQ